MPPRPEDLARTAPEPNPLDEWARLEQTKMLASLVQARIRAGLTKDDLRAMFGNEAVSPIESLDPDAVRLSALRRYAGVVGAAVSHHVIADPVAADD